MKTKQQLLKEAKELRQRLAQIDKRVKLMEVKQLQKTAGIIKEGYDPDMFLDAVFDTFNDSMRVGEMSEEDFDKAKDYIDDNERKIVSLFLKQGDDGIDAAVAHVKQAIGGGIQEEVDSDKDDQFWDIAGDTNFEEAIRTFKNAGFTVEEVTGFIESHWHRY